MSIVTRFAPSPTGFLHLGHGYSAFLNLRAARNAGGAFLLRLEDIDSGRCRPEYAAAALEDLAWLGLHWDGKVRMQSAHLPQYQAVLDGLAARGLLYPCFCTRGEIAQALTAPHGPDPVYPGTCRNLSAAAQAERIATGQKFAWRLNLARAVGEVGCQKFFAEGTGWVNAMPELLGDVVLGRKDFPGSYHLCVVHDDAAQGVTHIIRGEDLRASTHLHVLLQRLLSLPTPAYAFHPLLRDEAGKRLAKRDNPLTLREVRAAGTLPEALLHRFESGAP